MIKPENSDLAWVEITLLLSPHDTFKAMVVGDFDLADYTNDAAFLSISDNPELYAEIPEAVRLVVSLCTLGMEAMERKRPLMPLMGEPRRWRRWKWR